MKLPELHSASLFLRDNSEVRIINPKILQKKGMIYVSGILDSHFFKNVKDIEEKLELKRDRYTISEMFIIKGIENHGGELEISPVIISSINFNKLEVEFYCYGQINEKIKFNKSEKDFVYSISFEGLSIYYDSVTTTKQERLLLGKYEEHTLTLTKDFIQTSASFNHKGKTVDLIFALIKDKEDDLVHLIFHEDSRLSLELYNEIKFSILTFLSFACGNNINVRHESFYKAGFHHSILYSNKKVKKKFFSNFIPLNNISFLHKNILNDYMECFEVYLFIDEHLHLSQIVLLLNQAKKSQVDSSIFIMLIALEKLADRYITSPFFKQTPSFVMEVDSFQDFIKSIKTTFNTYFRRAKTSATQKQINDLWSRLVNVNKKGKTEDKIEQLLKFAEIEVTQEISILFTVLRNKAIHQGEIHLPETSAFENKLALELLLNRIISNLIQYRGLRYLQAEAGKNICEQKIDYSIDYTVFGLSKVIQRPTHSARQTNYILYF